jgi:hypothetical protein
MGEGNRVMGIEKRGDIYIVHALNNKNQERSIQVHPDGSIKNFKGGSKLEGYVDRRMQANIDAIFKHFETPLPKPGLSSAEKLMGDLSKSITSFGTQIHNAHATAKQNTLDAEKENVLNKGL